MAMKTISLDFTKRVPTGEKDGFNNPIYETSQFTVDGCLIAPITEPLDRVETAALDRDVAIVRLHLPKADAADVHDCTVEYEGRKWRIVGRPVKFMDENTPTPWNRYVRAEEING